MGLVFLHYLPAVLIPIRYFDQLLWVANKLLSLFDELLYEISVVRALAFRFDVLENQIDFRVQLELLLVALVFKVHNLFLCFAVQLDFLALLIESFPKYDLNIENTCCTVSFDVFSSVRLDDSLMASGVVSESDIPNYSVVEESARERDKVRQDGIFIGYRK